MSTSSNKTVIIGAGLTGLVTAYHLKKRGIPFTIIERNDRVGGVINTKRQKGFVFEKGPNSGVVSNIEVVELLEELKHSVDVEYADKISKARWICKGGRWRALPSGLLSAVATPLFSFKDKFRILGEPFRKAGTDPEENLAAMVRRRMGESFLKYAVDPFILGIYAGDPEYLVPKYALPKLYNLEQKYGSFIGGAIKKKRDKSVVNDKRINREIFSVRGGLSNLINALYNEVGAENVMLSCSSLKISKHDNGYNISYSSGDNKFDLCADNVISTIGGNSLPGIFSFLSKSDIKPITNLMYAPVSEVVVGFENWQGKPLQAFGGLIPHHENRKILGVLFLSSQFKNRAPEGGALMSLFVGGMRNQKMAMLPDSEIHNIVEEELKHLFGLKEFKPRIFKVYRHPYAIPQYGVQSAERLAKIDEIENTHKGLYLAGNIRNGIGMADRIKQAKDLAYII